jgi:hypothetical protein
MIEDGTGFITRTGGIYPASEGGAPDMVPPKASLNISVQHAAHSSEVAAMAAIPWYLNNVGDTEVQIFDDQLFTLQKSIALPHFEAGGSHYPGHGKFVFFNSCGSNIFVVMQADTASGLTNDFGVVTY